VLIVVAGLPGTGKSTLADGLGAALRIPVLSVDPIESAILRAGVAPSFETGLAAYLVAEACADACLRLGTGAIVDAVSSVDEARTLWRDLAARHGTPLRVLVCELDPAGAVARLAARDRGLALPEPSPADHAARRRVDAVGGTPPGHRLAPAGRGQRRPCAGVAGRTLERRRGPPRGLRLTTRAGLGAARPCGGTAESAGGLDLRRGPGAPGGAGTARPGRRCR
jgi:predicted kinase